ncbi:copper homeostasis membrane protein CopD [Pseudomonas syringae]|uniref:copper homeostasis membrane protein CopD n=1 Tax=Pseudomonas syringae TaxID=317 RepID=UPI001F462D72|nr:copper homeostasis membrane protein CopD [Pseudomonas syringae]MCF5181195.1 copper homeostasis membrane protein CopD [Pseudomonas syringae]MCF5313792.1 copper homeostasis membrane protein CopD [Pseudomonas syringae]MCF5361963.1 copper homeostasis membrane protein CopD [Pseudomonas syringae]MCF5389142.1 copper homeostasis membrane protein CopD [Pseudomonas syringae]MCF5401708.1 copper homeostasis membrane protein CopD [Pseudomonas syringae]
MSDPLNVVLRIALYLDLMLLFGLAVFGLYSFRGKERVSGAVLHFGWILPGTAAIGMLLSIAAFVVMTSNMSGASDWVELRPHIEMMLYETEIGYSWVTRMISLAMVIVVASQSMRWPTESLWVATLAGSIALATLAWTGHGAMDEGAKRFWHFAADILHLLAAGGWIGALAAFGLMLRIKGSDPELLVRVLSRALSGFETAGALIVGTVIVTGVANYLFIVGPTVANVISGAYGVLLLVKIVLFAGMIGLATLNRFYLSPAFERSAQAGDYSLAVTALRKSVVLESTCAVVIVVLVAWLGTLSPSIDMAQG